VGAGRGRKAGAADPAASTDPAVRHALERALGVRLVDDELHRTALTHRSFAFEHGLDITNERLEFLGDAILGMVVTDLAFRQFPDLSEGELAKLRAATVNMTLLADVARELGLGDLVFLGRGEEMSGGRSKASILADVMEAVLGAVYLDRGLGAVRRLIERLFWPRMAAYARGEGDRDHKTILQELASHDLGAVPEYRIAATGPDHAKEFTATVYLAGRRLGRGRGRSKKEAEQQAASQAFRKLTRERPTPTGASVASGRES
jgi:ribonuclease III